MCNYIFNRGKNKGKTCARTPKKERCWKHREDAMEKQRNDLRKKAREDAREYYKKNRELIKAKNIARYYKQKSLKEKNDNKKQLNKNEEKLSTP